MPQFSSGEAQNVKALLFIGEEEDGKGMSYKCVLKLTVNMV